MSHCKIGILQKNNNNKVFASGTLKKRNYAYNPVGSFQPRLGYRR